MCDDCELWYPSSFAKYSPSLVINLRGRCRFLDWLNLAEWFRKTETEKKMKERKDSFGMIHRLAMGYVLLLTKTTPTPPTRCRQFILPPFINVNVTQLLFLWWHQLLSDSFQLHRGTLIGKECTTSPQIHRSRFLLTSPPITIRTGSNAPVMMMMNWWREYGPTLELNGIANHRRHQSVRTWTPKLFKYRE